MQSGRAGRAAHGESDFPGYLHCRRVLDSLLRGDPDEIDGARERMVEAIEEAVAAAEGAGIEFWSRVAVVIRVSPGRASRT